MLLFSFNAYQGSAWVSSANIMSGMIYETSSGIEQFFSLVKNNEALTQRNLYLEQQVRALSAQITKQANDSSFMHMAEVKMLEHYHIIPAKVVANTTNQLDNLITINKGTSDGVHKNMGVSSGTGVVGIVLTASPHYAVVLPILNSKSSISCMIEGKGYFGYLRWDGSNPQYAFVDDIPRHARYKKGDNMVTSGYSSVFPPGMKVGSVICTFNSKDGLSYKVKIKLATDFSSLRDVCVIDDAQMKERMDILRAAQDSIK